MSEITTTLAELNSSVKDFTMDHEQKMAKVEEGLIKTTERLNQVEIALRRPHAGESKAENTEGFGRFVRKGIDDISAKAMISSNDAAGGYLIPSSAVNLINQHLNSRSTIRRLPSVAIITNDSMDMLLEKTEPDVGWVAETADRDETSTPELVKVSIPVHEVYARPRVSQRMLDDSAVNIEFWLADRIADKMAKTENQAFLFGNGAGKPKGILTYPTVEIGKGEWGKIESVEMIAKDSADKIMEAFYAMKSEYLDGACWVMSRKSAAKIRTMKDKSGSYIWHASISADQPNLLLGYPVHLCDDLPSEQDKIIFANMTKAYQVVDRSQMHVLRDPYSAKPYVEFYATKRVGGDVINFDAIKVISFKGES
ncbi:MAG: phage major capsid protein [Candidatus Paracaedibacteraceae bacterium]|nr:phage major capsid protein [Candidatus Paracaedibacteraceae bacterium]